jgi:hypothetical protein
MLLKLGRRTPERSSEVAIYGQSAKYGQDSRVLAIPVSARRHGVRMKPFER